VSLINCIKLSSTDHSPRPTLIYLFFGRRSILSSATFWQSIIYPPIFARIIDMSLSFLFDWNSSNISTRQKIAAYAHLYSFASVKSVVHWFQIMRTGCFQMYDDDLSAISPAVRTSSASYRPARFPTKNIKTPVVLMYGDCDSLVDIESMTSQLPSHTVSKRLHGYEHIDILWGRNVHKDVIPGVLKALRENNKGGRLTNGDMARADEWNMTGSSSDGG
jgi:lysosomal acid lipase/cholesteryl ester hydrolase